MENQQFAYVKTKAHISFAVTSKLISAFVFATQKVQSLYFLNTKFHASSCLLLLCSPVSVRPGQKPQRWFSNEAAQLTSGGLVVFLASTLTTKVPLGSFSLSVAKYLESGCQVGTSPRRMLTFTRWVAVCAVG